MSPAAYANRKQRRQAAALERKTGGVLVHPGELESLRRMQQLFVAIVRDQGRVRVTEETLASLKDGDRVISKSGDGAVTLSFVAGEDPQQGAPT